MGFRGSKISLFFSFLILVIGGYMLSVQTAKHPVRSPLHSIVCSVPEQNRLNFFSQLQAFGKENNFRVRIAPVHPVKKQFGIDMWRSDSLISADNLIDVGTFYVGFYAAEDGSYTMVTIDDLFQKLLKQVRKIDGVTIKVSK
jgi:hypothetical protein